MKRIPFISFTLVVSLLLTAGLPFSTSNFTGNSASNGMEPAQSGQSLNTFLADILNSLPDGGHDLWEGFQDQFSCGVVGWAADPDDRDIDLRVRILSDGDQVAQTVATTFRQDLADAGMCPGGTCSFTIDLWGLILPDVDHTITVQAQDAQTGEWGNVNNTPKTLNCSQLNLLPTGYHDGQEGVQNQYSCFAYGWVTDPDDRDIDLTVRILSDGVEVTQATASVFREDLETCPGGTCGFEFDLWGLISPDVDHSITSQAQDAQSGEWVDLSNTPKSLNCAEQLPPQPTPRFDVRVNNQAVEGWEWAEGETVTLQYNGISMSEVVGLAPWDPNQTYVLFNLDATYPIHPGDSVSMSNGTSTKTTVVTNLAITGIDLLADIVIGIATPSARIDPAACHEDGSGCVFRHVNADESGNWIADFSQPGIEVDEQDTFDIVPGSWVDSHQVDEDGDATLFGQNVPHPLIVADPTGDYISIYGLELGTEVTMTIDDPSTFDIDFLRVATVDYAPWAPGNPNEIIAYFDLAGEFDLQPGQSITALAGDSTNTYVVTNFAITEINVATNTASGVASPLSLINFCEGVTGECRYTTADESGMWATPPGDPGSFVLEPGVDGWASEYEEDYDQTTELWNSPTILEVTIDIRPWVDPNLALCRSGNELIPVAVLSTSDFNATTLDADSIRFGRTGTEAAVARAGKNGPALKFTADFNHDNLPDIAYYFRLGDTGFSCSDIPAGQHSVDVQGILMGTAGDLHVQGQDSLKLVRILLK